MRRIEKLPADKKAKLGQIYDKYKRKMYAAAFSVLKDQSDAEDAIQNSVLKLANVIDELDGKPDGIICGYLITVARNEAYNIIRAKDKAETLDTFDNMPDKNDPTVTVTEGAEFEFAVSVMQTMDEKYRAPLYLRYVMSFSLKDTAKQLGRNEATVRSQISRGLSILKKALKEAGYES